MAFNRIQRQTAASGANVTTLTATWSPTPTPNNLLLCRANCDATATMNSSGWTLAHSQINLSGLYLWYKIALAGESTSVTVNPTSSASLELIIEEWAGGLSGTVAVLDRIANATGASTGTTAATTQADELAIAQVGMSNTPGTGFSATWTNSFTAETTLVGAGGVSTALHPAFRVLTATGTVTTTATPAGGGTASGGLVATFKMALPVPLLTLPMR